MYARRGSGSAFRRSHVGRRRLRRQLERRRLAVGHHLVPGRVEERRVENALRPDKGQVDGRHTPAVSPSTISGLPAEPLYSPANVRIDYERDLGDPGEFPFTRGVYESMYRGRPWTMRQFAGFGTAEETNERFLYLLEHGQTGLSVAFDMPTLMGYDSDHPRSLGEVGREGVAVDSLEDAEVLFRDIPLGEVSTSMTINAPAAMLLAFYVCVAEEQGVPRAELRGTIQTDILKEYIAQKEWIFPPGPSMRLVVDMIEFCAREMPLWHPVSISGYHIREAGSTAAQELAFTLADGFAYVEASLARGLAIDEFAPRLSFFFNAHIDFFEEIAKYRAARRIWARELRDRFGASDQRSLLMRFHTQTAGVSLTAQQPELNVVRTALEALAAVLGGTQSLHTNSFDEALALPTEHAAKLALRTQQIIADETGVATTPDPLGGSWYLEDLTQRLETEAYEYFEPDRGTRRGRSRQSSRTSSRRRSPRRRSAIRSELERGERVIVGVNRYEEGDPRRCRSCGSTRSWRRSSIERVRARRAGRDPTAAEAALARLRAEAADETESHAGNRRRRAGARHGRRDVRRAQGCLGHLARDSRSTGGPQPNALLARTGRPRPGRSGSRTSRGMNLPALTRNELGVRRRRGRARRARDRGARRARRHGSPRSSRASIRAEVQHGAPETVSESARL